MHPALQFADAVLEQLLPPWHVQPLRRQLLESLLLFLFLQLCLLSLAHLPPCG
jgi:hypothetical protein